MSLFASKNQWGCVIDIYKTIHSENCPWYRRMYLGEKRTGMRLDQLILHLSSRITGIAVKYGYQSFSLCANDKNVATLIVDSITGLITKIDINQNTSWAIASVLLKTPISNESS